jgi:deazaflavin-dependent oxidoreductase (nitroreductase family)
MTRAPATARTLPVQSLVNRVVRVLLRAPLVSRVVGKRLLIVYAVGRRSGRRYSVPVAYTNMDGGLLVASQFPWIGNLRSGQPVDVCLLGRTRVADVVLVADEPAVVNYLAAMCRANHQFARFNRIGLDPNGSPLPEDLHRAWGAGARVAILAPR